MPAIHENFLLQNKPIIQYTLQLCSSVCEKDGDFVYSLHFYIISTVFAYFLVCHPYTFLMFISCVVLLEVSNGYKYETHEVYVALASSLPPPSLLSPPSLPPYSQCASVAAHY